jgi:ABC-type lipoprotein export system ATPase subunit
MAEAETQTQAAICSRGVTRDFKAGQQTITVLHGIDVDIRAGELTYVVGESGSGTTRRWSNSGSTISASFSSSTI